MLNEGEKLVPSFKNFRILRAWAGVRPLYHETKLSESRDINPGIRSTGPRGAGWVSRFVDHHQWKMDHVSVDGRSNS